VPAAGRVCGLQLLAHYPVRGLVLTVPPPERGNLGITPGRPGPFAARHGTARGEAVTIDGAMVAPAPPRSRRRLFLPEVVQISAMDCGPATLKALLSGYGVRVSYGRLREACQTAVDGTSIDTLEDLARGFGLDAEQVLLPPDHLFASGARALPAIAVVRQADGLPHFVVVWSRHGRVLQVVDPATGRRWPRCDDLERSLYLHAMPVEAEAWRRWAGTDEAIRAFRGLVRRAGASASDAAKLVESALADPSWHGIASLEAAARMTAAMVKEGGVEAGREASRLLETLREGARAAGPESGDTDFLPTGFWSVRPAEPGPDGEERLLARGAVCVRVRGPAESPPDVALPPEIVAALEEPPERPFRDLLRRLLEGGAFAPLMIALALVLASVTVVFQALVFRGLLDIGRKLALPVERLAGLSILAFFVAATLLLDWPIALSLRRLGRHVETRIRAALLAAIPRLHDRYFQSRLVSDMADRSHGLHLLRALPDVCGGFLRSAFELLLTAAAIVWIDPGLAPLAAVAAIVVVLLPLAAQPLLAERDLRVRSQAGALSRFYLDAMIGLVPIRTHGAERIVRRQHDSELVRWAQASVDLLRAAVAVEAAMLVAGLGLAAALLFTHLSSADGTAGALLLAYWALRLPMLGQEVVGHARGYVAQKNASLRALEPLGAAEKASDESRSATSEDAAPVPAGPLPIRLENVKVVAGGHEILDGIDLTIAAGEHVAIVGASGAGKSSLLGLLLGWHRPASGRVLVGGEPLEGARLDALRRRTAWVDPAVQLWNKTLLENLLYGSGDAALGALAETIERARLGDVLSSLPLGLRTPLGESGGFVSGGEGQRVRLARAILRPDAALAILDEPFRGLDRDRRDELLRVARERWKDATLLCVTHDIEKTLEFDRVLVVEGGRIAEDGPPARLAARDGSIYRRLLDADRSLREGFSGGAGWARLELRDGRIEAARRTPR